MEQKGAEWISDGAIAVMFESARMFTLTDYAVKRSGTIVRRRPTEYLTDAQTCPRSTTTTRRCGLL